jgi:hypothetical protein
MRWVEEWTKAQAWGCPCITPRNIQEVQASKLGDAPEAPLLHRQKSGHLSRHYIFIASCTMCFSWSVSCFSFLSLLVCFVCCNKWLYPNKFPLEEMYSFSFAKECSSFHSYLKSSILVFLLLLLVFVFALICVQTLSYLFIKVYFCLWSLLVFIKRGVYKNFKWCWKREKALCKIVVQEGACVDCGLGFFMSCLMSFW